MAPVWRPLAPCVFLICPAAAVQPAPELARASASLAAVITHAAPSAAIVTLGQSLNPDGSPAQVLVRRTDTAAAARQEFTEAPIVVTGADPARVGVTEAEVMRRLLTEQGVPEASVTLEPRANNTVQNAIFSLGILRSLGARRVVLVTSDFHMPRAQYTFEAVFDAQAAALELAVEPRPAKGGCPLADAKPGVNINEQSLVQRLRGEEAIITEQLQQALLPADLPGVRVPTPGKARLERALAEVRAQLRAAGAA